MKEPNDKEVTAFIERYINGKPEALRMLVANLAPYDLSVLVEACMREGMVIDLLSQKKGGLFNWK